VSSAATCADSKTFINRRHRHRRKVPQRSHNESVPEISMGHQRNCGCHGSRPKRRPRQADPSLGRSKGAC
jgi:hypothetical protein